MALAWEWRVRHGGVEIAGQRVDGVDTDVHVEIRYKREEFSLLRGAVYGPQYGL